MTLESALWLALVYSQLWLADSALHKGCAFAAGPPTCCEAAPGEAHRQKFPRFWAAAAEDAGRRAKGYTEATLGAF